MARNKAKSFSETISKLEAMMTAAAKSKESTVSFCKEMGKPPKDLAPVHKKQRVPLMEVVRNCNRRWFQETLKEAKDGNADKQVLLGQMYRFGYGVKEDDHRGRYWLKMASKRYSMVKKVMNKPPGYNDTDSNSDEAASTKK